MNYIYIDESGDLGNDSNHIIMGAIIVNDSNKLDRIINKVRKNYKKQLSGSSEIKATKTKKHIKKKIIKNLNKINYNVIVIVFDKKNKHKISYDNNKNLLYDILASKLAEELKITSKTIIIIDKSKNKERYIQNFNSLFISKLNNPNNYPLSLKHENSVKHKGLQIADLISWSSYQYIEHDNDEYIKLIKYKTIKKVFED